MSAGVTFDQSPDTPLASLFDDADAALYKAKLNGRNRIQCSGEAQPRRPYPRLVRVA